MKLTKEYLRRLIKEALSEADSSLMYSSEKQCIKDKGSFCYMYKPRPKKTKPIKNKKTEPTVTLSKPDNIKKEDKMIRKPNSYEVLKKNELEIENFINSDISDALREIALDKIVDLEQDENSYSERFSKIGSARIFIEDCIDELQSRQ